MKAVGKVARRGVAVVWAVVLLVGCSEPLERSSVRIEIDADDAVRAASAEVNVRVEKADDPAAGWSTVAQRRFTPTEAHGWPISFQLPRDATEQPGSYQLTATALDNRNAVLGLVRVIRDFRHRTRVSTLRAFFEVECLRLTLCDQGMTCHDGECVSSESTDEELGTVANAQQRAPAPAAPTGMQAANAMAMGRADEACAREGETACAQAERQMPLTCHDGRWRAELPCQQDERCVASEGSCRAIARECVGRGDDDVFCDGATMRDCSDPVAPPVRPCGEHSGCAVRDGEVGCACSLGFVKDVVDCRPATACEADHGGCDQLASCNVVGNAVQCGACPSGYAGDGRTGCLPLLAALEVSGAMVSPSLAPGAREYRARVPLLTTRAQLTASGPPDTTLEIDTHPIAAGTPWISPILDYGDNAFELAVVSRSGVRSVYRVIIQRDGEQRAYVKAGDPGASDWLGLAWMSATQDTLVVGAPWEDGGSTKINGDETSNGAVDSGAAYVFVRDGQTWIKQAYLKASDGAASDFFAAATSVSGDTIAIGARRADFVGLVRRPGAVYVFDRKNGAWSQTVRIAPEESTAGDLFGNAVSIDADTLVVGAPRVGGATDSAGAVYVYERAGGAWTLQQTLRASKPVPRSSFGTLVILRDGVLVVGATDEDDGAGAAYVFTRGSQGWVQRQRLAPDSLRSSQRFGWTIETLGDTLVIGAPFASDLVGSATLPAGETYVFQRAGETWQQVGVLSAIVPRSNDYFGASVALTSQAIVVGAAGDDSDGRGVRADPRHTGANQSGAAYVFSRDPAGWRSPTFIKSSNTESDDAFGWTVAATETDFFVSAPWESSNGGDQANNSVTNSGALYVFR